MPLHDVAPGSVFLTKIFDKTLGAAASSFDTGANGIDAGFSALQVYLYARTSRSSTTDGVKVTLNGDTGNNYDSQIIQGSGATAVAAQYNAIGFFYNSNLAALPGDTTTANVFGVLELVIPAYDQTTGFKSGRFILSQPDEANTLQSTTAASLWRSTAAINQITISPSVGPNFKAGSRLLIYGLP